MPKLLQQDDNMVNYPVVGVGSFQFSAIRPDKLGASQYTLVTMAVDVSGSVADFANELVETVKSIVKACQKSPRAENLMLRLLTYNQNLFEVHGFKPLGEINPDDYQSLICDGFTALFDATYSSIGATLSYAKTLIDQDFDVNGAVYIITDGADNRSTTTPKQIAKLMEKAVKSEDIESLISVLVGINASECLSYLEEFKEKGGLTQFIDVGDATPQKLAKLAGFVSKSISSQSQALGTGGPSQSLTF
jgi:uncharacterized protein YegL